MGISQGLDGEAGSKVKLNDVLEIYLLWVNMLCAHFHFVKGDLIHFTATICLDSVRNIDESTRINTEMVWGSS